MSTGAPGGRPRAGRPPGPADPRVAVRLGGVAGPDRLLRRALARLAHDAVRGDRLAPGAGPGSRALLVNPVTEALAGACRGLPARRRRSGRASTGPRRPDRNFSVTFVFVTVWLGLVVAQRRCSATSFAPSTRGARSPAPSAALFKLIAGQSPPPPLTLSRAARALARRRRRARLRLARARLRRLAAFRSSA